MVSPQSSMFLSNHLCGQKRKIMGFDQMGGGRRRKMGVGGGENIDSLPDDLVLNILGRLKFKEAAATALVSPRLLNFWAFLTHLDFKEDDADPQQQEDDADPLQQEYDPDPQEQEYDPDPQQQPLLSGIHFMKFVNFILNRHRASSVDSVRIAFDAVGIEEYEGSLEKWVEFARLKTVRSLEIDLHHSARGSPAASKSGFCFPLHELYGLRTLTSLSLKFVSILDEDDVVYLLERSLVNLETLVIENASGLKNLKIKAQKLKHLSIRYCPDLCSIHIVSAPNLQYLEKAADFNIDEDFNIVQLTLGCTVLPNLSSVNLRGLLRPNLLLELQEYAPYLEKLELDVCAEQSNFGCREYPKIFPLLGNIPGHFPHLGNIKQLVLNFSVTDKDGMMDLMFILAACPNLQDLTLNYVVHLYLDPENDRDRHWGKPSSYTHASLKTVTFVGWSGRNYELHLASYLMKIATNLQMVTFDTNPAYEDCYMGYREGEPSSFMKKYFQWQRYLSTVQELVDNKPYSVAFRYALLRLPPKDWGVPTYEDWEERCWMKPTGIEKYWFA